MSKTTYMYIIFENKTNEMKLDMLSPGFDKEFKMSLTVAFSMSVVRSRVLNVVSIMIFLSFPKTLSCVKHK